MDEPKITLPVPLGYIRLRVFTPEEVNYAVAAGYVVRPEEGAKTENASAACSPNRSRPKDDISDWRTRMYVVWFCYIYEHLKEIEKPLQAIEQIVLEFRAPTVIDAPGRFIGSLYAGMGGTDPVPARERDRQLKMLKPHYEKAIALLDGFRHGAFIGQDS